MPVPGLAAIATVASVGEAAHLTVEKLRDVYNEYAGIRSLDSFEQRFFDKMNKHLRAHVADGIPEDAIREALDDSRDHVFEPLTVMSGETSEAVVDEIFDRMTSVLIQELELEKHDYSAETLRPALETAYHEARQEYIRSVDDDADRLELDLLIDLKENMQRLTDEVSLRYQPTLFGEQQYDRVVLDQVSRPAERAADSLRRETEYHDLEFSDRESRERIANLDQQFQLIVGRKGSGKTRTLLESLDELLETGAIGEVVTVPGKRIENGQDLGPLFDSQAEGAMLVLWDDIHRTDGGVVESIVERLDETLAADDRSLYVRATVRRRYLDSFLADDLSLSTLQSDRVDRGSRHETLQRFSTVELPPLDEDQIGGLVDRAIRYFELDVSPSVREALVQKVLDADPTPFYVTSFCERHKQKGRITEYDVQEFPDSAVSSWRNAYNDATPQPEQDLLNTLMILDDLDASVGSGLIDVVYTQALDRRRTTDRLDWLERHGWLTTDRARHQPGVIGREQVVIHDVRLEAIATEFEYEDWHRSLLDLFTGDSIPDRLRRHHANEWAKLIANYAGLVRRKQLGGSYSMEDARELFDRAVDLNESGAAVHLQYAEFLRHGGDHVEVTEQFERAIEQDPEEPRLYLAYGQYIQSQDTEKAAQIYENGIDATGDAKLYREYAEFLRDRDPDRVEDIHREGIDATEDPMLYLAYAGFLRDRDPDRVEDIFREGIDTTGDAELYRYYAQFLRNRDPDRAEDIYREGVDATGNPGLLLSYAEFLGNHDPDRAENLYREGIDSTGEAELYWHYAGFLENRDPDRAEDIYREGIDATGDAELYQYYAEFLEDRDPDRAEDIYREGIDATGDRRLYRRYAELLEDDDPDRAEDIYREGIYATGGAMSYWHYARFLEDRDPERAENLYHEGIDATGDRRLYRRYATLLEDRDPGRAEDIYREGIDATGDVLLYRNYASWLEDRDPNRAEDIYREGIRAGHSFLLRDRYVAFLEQYEGES